MVLITGTNITRKIDRFHRKLRESFQSEGIAENGLNENVKNYGQNFVNEIRNKKTSFTQENFIFSALNDAHVVLLGDYHSLDSNLQLHLKILQYLQTTEKKLVVLLEIFQLKDEPEIVKFMNFEMSALQLLERTNLNSKWGFDPENYFPLLNFLRLHKIVIKAADLDQRKNLENRDHNFAKQIIQARQHNPQAVIVLIVGEFHLCNLHIPKQIRKLDRQTRFPRYGRNIHIVRIFYNLAYFYSRQMANNNKLDFQSSEQWVRLDNKTYCLLDAPEWIKDFSFIRHLTLREQTLQTHELFDYFLKAVSQFLNLKNIILDRYNFYYTNTAQFKEKYENADLNLIVEYFPGYYDPGSNNFMLKELSKNMLMQFSLAYVHQQISPTQYEFLEASNEKSHQQAMNWELHDLYRQIFLLFVRFTGNYLLNPFMPAFNPQLVLSNLPSRIQTGYEEISEYFFQGSKKKFKLPKPIEIYPRFNAYKPFDQCLIHLVAHSVADFLARQFLVKMNAQELRLKDLIYLMRLENNHLMAGYRHTRLVWRIINVRN